MTQLLTVCKNVADQHAPEGEWKPSTQDLYGQFSESMTLIADVSRTLDRTRRGMRTITGRARQRLHDSTPGPVGHPQPD